MRFEKQEYRMKWFEEFKESTKQTKYFILTWVFYGLIIVASLIYSYARIDYVRTAPVSAMKESVKEQQPNRKTPDPGQQPPS